MLNKVLGAVLGTLLALMVIKIAAEAIFDSGEEETHVSEAAAPAGEAAAPAGEAAPAEEEQAAAPAEPAPGGAMAGPEPEQQAAAPAEPAPGGAMAGPEPEQQAAAPAEPAPGGAMAGPEPEQQAAAPAEPAPGGAMAGPEPEEQAAAPAEPAPGGAMAGPEPEEQAAAPAQEPAPAAEPAPAQQQAAAPAGEAGGLTALIAAADPAAGKRIAARCIGCHSLEEGQPNKVGPNLYNIVGAPLGHAEGYAYSDAIKTMHEAGDTWTYERLDAFLTKPAADIPGTKMSFPGLGKAEDRAALIAYLRSQSASPQPLP